MKNQCYKLDESGNPVPVSGMIEWAVWFERSDRQVSRTVHNGCEVSTVFLGLDHSWNLEGPPVLWETMVFGGPLSEETNRCSGTKADAQQMHSRMVSRVKWETSIPGRIARFIRRLLRR